MRAAGRAVLTDKEQAAGTTTIDGREVVVLDYDLGVEAVVQGEKS